MSGPKNFTKSGTGPQPRSPATRRSAAPSARVQPSKASAGVGRPPAGGGSGTRSTTTPMASAPKKSINKPKTGPVSRGTRLPKPRADFPSKI